MAPPADYFTHWSMVAEGMAVAGLYVLRDSKSDVWKHARASLACFAIANALAVGYVGSIVAGWGTIRGAPMVAVTRANAQCHALPSMVASLLLIGWSPCVAASTSVGTMLTSLLICCVLNLLFFFTRDSFALNGVQKVQNTYGMPAVQVSGSLLCVQTLLVVAITMSRQRHLR